MQDSFLGSCARACEHIFEEDKHGYDYDSCPDGNISEYISRKDRVPRHICMQRNDAAIKHRGLRTMLHCNTAFLISAASCSQWMGQRKGRDHWDYPTTQASGWRDAAPSMLVFACIYCKVMYDMRLDHVLGFAF